jgi:hypothetical protein
MNTNRVGSRLTGTTPARFAPSDAGIDARTTSAMRATISRKNATETATMRWSSPSNRATSRFSAK